MKGIPRQFRSESAAHHTDFLEALERVFFAAGFRFERQEGSHRAYVKPGTLRPVIIPTYKQVPVSIIRNNLKTAGISRDEYFRLLEGKR